MRDDPWLNSRLVQIWEMLFPEVPKLNNVKARFKGRWENKFGHIKRLEKTDTEIAINSLFRNDIIPEYIVDLKMAHELIHYSHGFNSPLPKRYKHPHAGGIVTRELRARGFGHLLRKEKTFVKNDWLKIYKTLCPEKAGRKYTFRFF